MSCMNGSWILVWMQCTIDVLQPSSSPGFQHPMSLWGLMESFGLQVGGWVSKMMNFPNVGRYED